MSSRVLILMIARCTDARAPSTDRPRLEYHASGTRNQRTNLQDFKVGHSPQRARDSDRCAVRVFAIDCELQALELIH